jgi:hypothetical protein
VFKNNVLSFNVAKLTKACAKCLDQDLNPCITRSLRMQNAYPRNLPGLLRRDRKADPQEPNGEREANKFFLPHSLP